jgi:hypothetical protein
MRKESGGKEWVMTRRIVVMMAALLCMALALGSLGCGNSSSKGNPEQSVTDFWNALSKGDVQGALKYISREYYAAGSMGELENEDSYAKEQMMTMKDYMDLVPVSSKVSGDTAVVKAELTAPDLDAIGDQLMTIVGELMASGFDIENMTEEQLDEAYMKKVQKLMEEAPSITNEEDIDMVWEDDMWKINSNPFAAMVGVSGM